MERVGMTFEGIAREGMLIKGNYVDVGTCAILRKEWETLRKETSEDVYFSTEET
jgi:RimJ/RimL family protein N-acetyltransferase